MKRKFSAVLIGGLIAGAFDISYAVIYSWFRSDVAPERILQSVASGLLGNDAYAGGAATATLGFLLHFLMAILIAIIYWRAAQRLPSLVQRPILYGSLYGLGVYLFMNLVVLPLSRIPPRSMPAVLTIVTSIIVHTLLFGVPIALAVRKALRQESDVSTKGTSSSAVQS